MDSSRSEVDQLKRLLLNDVDERGDWADDAGTVASLISKIKEDVESRRRELHWVVLQLVRSLCFRKSLSKPAKMALRDLPPLVSEESFWKEVLECILEPDVRKHTVEILQVLCHLTEIPACFRCNGVWEILAEGLSTFGNPLAKKRANYIMKRLLTNVTNSDIDISLEDNPMVAIPFRREIWNDFFTVVETLEESQVHIVNQVTGKIGRLMTMVQYSEVAHLTEEKPLHMIWILVIFKILLQHCNMTIMKCGLEFFLREFPNVSNWPQVSSHPLMLRFYKTSLFPALNTTKFFTYQSDHSCSLETLLSGFVTSRHAGSSPASDSTFWNTVISSLCSVNWGSIPLLHVVRSFSNAINARSVSLEGSLASSAINAALNFMKVQTEAPLIVGASRCHMLNILIRLGSPESILCGDETLENVSKCISKNFFNAGISPLIRGSTQWRQFIGWLNGLKISEMENIKKRVASSSSTNAPSLAWEILLNNDINTPDDTFLKKMMTYLVESLVESSDRVYRGDQIEVDIIASVLILTSLPEKRKGREFLRYDDVSRNVIKEGSLKFDSLKSVPLIEELLRILSTEPENRMIDNVVRILDYIHLEFPEMSLDQVIVNRNVTSYLLAGLKIFPTVIKSSHEYRKKLLCPLKADDFWLSLNRSQGTKQLCRWKYLESLCSYDNLDHEVLVKIVKSAARGISSKTRSFVSIMKILTKICSLETDSLMVQEDMFKRGIDYVNSHKKHNTYSPYLEAFMEMAWIFLLKSGKSRLQIEEIINGLISKSESTVFIIPVLVSSLEPCIEGQCGDSILEFLAEFLVFGPVQRKENVQMNIANRIVANEKGNLSVNLYEGSSHKLASDTRLKATKIVLALIRGGNLSVSRTIHALCDLDKAITKGKDRHFEHSLIHLTRHRVYQMFLLLTDLDLEREDVYEIFEIAMKSITQETQQLSVRYLSEWVICRLLKSHPELIQNVNRYYEDAVRKGLGIHSFLTIYYHIARLTKDYDKALLKISHWCMGQHFATRAYAYVYVGNLLKDIEDFPDLFSKYSILSHCIDQISKCKEGSNKNLERISSDFYLNVFDPWDGFTLQEIFHDFPRLCKLPDPEIAEIDALDTLPCEIPLTDSKSRMNRHIVGDENFKCFCESCFVANDAIPNEPKMEAADSASDNIQRKFMPFNLDPEGICDLDEFKTNDATRAHKNLVLCASLIDKPTNLGGLCRTCEIFELGEYIIPDKKFVEDKQFKSLSVTAHQWTPIKEVKPHHLVSYLESMKCEGYSIIGIEQTSESTSLERFQFDPKTVMILGNEKQGIPVEVINVVDKCVEIPQSGLVRSFNVHVTGAIVIWEYVRQMMS